MLGKAFLQQRKWAEAIAAFDELIALNEYKLNNKFEDNFAGEQVNINQESIFEVQFKFDDNVRSETGRYGTWSTYYEIAVPTSQVLDAFYPNDKRYALTIGRGGSPLRDAFVKYPGFEETPYLFGRRGKKHGGIPNPVPDPPAGDQPEPEYRTEHGMVRIHRIKMKKTAHLCRERHCLPLCF